MIGQKSIGVTRMQVSSTLLVLMAAALPAALANPVPSNEVVTLHYERKDNTTAPMDIRVDSEARTISYHMKDQGGFFADVSTFEDYGAGYAVSKLASQDICFLRQLFENFDVAVERLHHLRNQGIQHNLGDVHVWVEPIKDLEGMAGSRLTSFCADSPAYELVILVGKFTERKPGPQQDSSYTALSEYLKKDSSTKALDSNGSERQITVTFKKCVYFIFWLLYCLNTAVTFVTGATFTFIPLG